MFNEAKAFISGKEALSEILEILKPLKDNEIEYEVKPDANNDIKVKTFGLFINGNFETSRNFEIEIKTKKYSNFSESSYLNDEQQQELELVIKHLTNYFETFRIKLTYQFSYERNFAKGYGRIGDTTNIIKTENFDKSMLNKKSYNNKDNFCRRIIIKLKRENNI
jgi:hypothetical protein